MRSSRIGRIGGRGRWRALGWALAALLATGTVSTLSAQGPPSAEGRATALFLLGLEARQAGDARSAARWLEASVGLDPGAVLPRLEWAAALLALGRPAEARAALQPIESRIDSIAGEDAALGARGYRLLGATASRAGDVKTAIELYERAVRYAPRDLGLRAQLIGLQSAHGTPEAAIEHMRAAAEMVPGNADLRVQIGRTLLDLARWTEAQAAFESALALQLDHEDAWDGLGLALAGQQRYASAEEAFRAGLEIAPASARLYEHLGDALLDRGQAGPALNAYRRAAALSPGDAAGLAAKIERARSALTR